MAQIISVVGKSNSGKTTLIEKIIPILRDRGYRVGVIKHTSHTVDMDKKGKDSWRHKNAGADAVMVSSPGRFSLVKDVEDPSLEELCGFLGDLDLIITEGYKRESMPKIEVFRREAHDAPLFVGHKELEAFVTDSDLDQDPGVPCFRLDDAGPLADFIENHFLK